jgi:hypothetical protein
MATSPIIEFIAREHPAFVHVPLGLAVVLPVAMFASFKSKKSLRWIRISFFMACLAVLSSLAALFSGLMWGRQISLIPVGGFYPKATTAAQVLQHMLQLHILAALAGVIAGGISIVLMWQKWRPNFMGLEDTAIHHHKQMNRRAWERGVGVPVMFLSLIWVGAWGFCGKLGGIMVFGNEETNKASAEAEAKRKNDVEADIPIRALDYASLEPVEAAPIRSQAHGDRWRRIWVTASGIDAYKAGKPLPPGAYAVLTTFEDEKGKPSHEPGPLYMKETKSDGTTGFAFYWPRVPDALRSQVGGADSVYWRSPDPKLGTCLGCHERGTPQPPANPVPTHS